MGNDQSKQVIRAENEQSLWKVSYSSAGSLPIWHRSSQKLVFDNEIAELKANYKMDDKATQILGHKWHVGYPEGSTFLESLLKKLEVLRQNNDTYCRRGKMNVFRGEPEAITVLEVTPNDTCGLVRFTIKVVFTMYSSEFDPVMKSLSYEKIAQLFKRHYESLSGDVPKIKAMYTNGALESDGWMSYPTLTVIVKVDDKLQSKKFKEAIEKNGETLAKGLTKDISEIFAKELLATVSAEFLQHSKLSIDDKSIICPGGNIFDAVDPSRIESFKMVSGWVPALVNVTNGVAKFTSEISGIPLTIPNAYTYKQLEIILSMMLPAFTKIGVSLGDEPKVIVRSQMYDVEEGDEYFSMLHQEGPQGEISAVGLYYPRVDSTLKGGELELTTVLRGGCGSRYPGSADVQISTGTAVVFRNDIVYHQVKSLSGHGKRWMLAFFILAPTSKLAASDTIMVNARNKAISYLKQMQKEVNVFLPDSVQELIASYVVSHMSKQYQQITTKLMKPITKEGLQVSAMD